MGLAECGSHYVIFVQNNNSVYVGPGAHEPPEAAHALLVGLTQAHPKYFFGRLSLLLVRDLQFSIQPCWFIVIFLRIDMQVHYFAELHCFASCSCDSISSLVLGG